MKKIFLQNYIYFLVFLFFVISFPVINQGNRNYSEIWSYDMDETYLISNTLRILNFDYPKLSGPYGNFPYFLCGILFFPVILFYKMNSIHFNYSQAALMLHITQIFTGSLAFIYFYKFGVLFKSNIMKYLGSLLVFLCGANWVWTLNIHPDIFQSSFLLVSFYYFARYITYNEAINNWDLIISAFFIGCSIGSKFWGIFAFPAILYSIASVNHFRLDRMFIQASIYFFVSVFTFFLFNLNIIYEYYDVVSLYHEMQKLNMRLAFSPFFLYKFKISNFTSSLFYGDTIIVYFIGSGFYFIKQWKLKKDLSILPIFITIFVFVFFYFFLYMDSANVSGGERYIIGFIILMLVPVLLSLDRLSKNERYSWLVWIAIFLFCLSHFLRITGNPADIITFLPKYPERSLFENINFFYQRENRANFQIRKWITSNIQRGDTILVEYYMNITSKPDDNKDLPSINITSSRTVTYEKILVEQPDYAFAKVPMASEDLAKLANYQLMEYPKGESSGEEAKIYIYKKMAELPESPILYSFYKKFPVCEKDGLVKFDAPWESSIAALSDSGFIFSSPDTNLVCKTRIEYSGRISLIGRVGFWSGSKSWGVSDGAIVSINVKTSKKDIREVYRSKILPEGEFQNIKVNLSNFKNKELTFILSVKNEKGSNTNGDWIVWDNPRIVKN